MKSICGINCDECKMKCECKGCEATCGKPFGGSCIAAEYIRFGGKAEYIKFKMQLLEEINELLAANDVPPAESLFELSGAYVNLAYPLPSGQAAKFLDDSKIYLGCQIEFGDEGVCYGVVADTTFILVCSYSVNGNFPELVAFKRR